MASVVHLCTTLICRPGSKGEAAWYHRHVLLHFNLGDPNVDIMIDDACSLLYNLFPGTTNVNFAIDSTAIDERLRDPEALLERRNSHSEPIYQIVMRGG